jgi:hypothetical protein
MKPLETNDVTCYTAAELCTVYTDEFVFLYGNTRFSSIRRTTSSVSIDMKICTVDYISAIAKCAKIVGIGWLGVAETTRPTF